MEGFALQRVCEIKSAESGEAVFPEDDRLGRVQSRM